MHEIQKQCVKIQLTFKLTFGEIVICEGHNVSWMHDRLYKIILVTKINNRRILHFSVEFIHNIQQLR